MNAMTGGGEGEQNLGLDFEMSRVELERGPDIESHQAEAALRVGQRLARHS